MLGVEQARRENKLYKSINAGTPRPIGLRITYGKKTQPHAHPWNIAMYNNGRFHCGGTLISSRHILTAAHCVIKSRRRPEKLKLSIGDWDINSNLDGPSLQGEIVKIVTHPGYSTHTLKYDVAVLTLKENVQFTDTIVPICLPEADFDLEGQLITVSGWGRDERKPPSVSADGT
ncbi:Serine protease easter [Armadillidium nasatum]|uniref:Serine protease easter n=1 Tax=Armadillidium nasatum TaxID=96803 RepID=A0A5N5SQN2_9CRUS|nr:Serine protease easter [Armadillidium nasatum]